MSVMEQYEWHEQTTYLFLILRKLAHV